MPPCTFCDILAGKRPASIVFRDDRCCAFMDIRQGELPGHVLVVPVVHATSLAALDEETGAQMFRIAQRIAGALRRSIPQCQGVNLYLADGVAAGQVVPHVHLHLFPRRADDGFGLRVGPRYFQRPTKAQLDDIAADIQAAL